MYVARGELTVKERPEALLGKWVVDETMGRLNVRVLGGKRAAAFMTGVFKRLGLLPSWATPEHIDSVETAEQYARESQKDVTVTKFRPFDAAQELERRVPKGTELVGAEAGVYRETRLPSPVVYFLGHRTLLETVEYSADNGWQRDTDPMPATETQVGVMTPVLSLWATFSLDR